MVIMVVVASFFWAGIYAAPKILKSWRWHQISGEARAAAAGFPQQFGLTKTQVIKCVPVPPPMTCPQHRLCLTKPPSTCGSYTVVTGAEAGGDGFEIILNSLQYNESGYKAGDDIIAAGISDALIEVVASPNGCSGCQ